MRQRFDKQDEKNIDNTEMHPANKKAREFSRYLHHLQKLQKPLYSIEWLDSSSRTQVYQFR